MKRRVSGEGLPYPKRPDRRGDLIVDYDVKFPDRLSQGARDTIAQVLPRSWTWPKDPRDFITLSCRLGLFFWGGAFVSHHMDGHEEVKITPDNKGQTHGEDPPLYTVKHSVNTTMGKCSPRMSAAFLSLKCKYDWYFLAFALMNRFYFDENNCIIIKEIYVHYSVSDKGSPEKEVLFFFMKLQHQDLYWIVYILYKV